MVVCPRCRRPLGDRLPTADVACPCGASWPVRDGFVRFVEEEAVTGNDRLLRPFYEHLSALHDPAVRYTLPLFGTGTEANFRGGYIPLLELDSLSPGARILDVGVGTGADLPWIAERAPGPIEVWGIDLAAGMLRRCRRRVERGVAPLQVRLAVADAHALPFPDGTFDRVLHVGATNSFRDPRRALAEMARVAKPGAPIVFADERLDPSRRHSLVHRAIFRAICFYEPYPAEPTSFLPEGAYDVVDRQVARFLYAVRFRATPASR